MNNLDEAYNQAIDMLKKGHSKQEVLVKFAQFQNELAPLLDISASLLSLPKNIVPTPLMRRKYAAAKAKTFWLAWLHVSKFAAVSVGLMLIVSALSVTAYEASISTPGNVLFSLKQGEENVRLVLASSQNQKASLQVAIAQQRLSDAKQIFNDPSSNQEQKTAALVALTDQTTSAIAQVNTVASANPKSDQNHPLLNSLDSITKEQQNLLAQITPDPQIKSAADTALVALNSNTSKLSQIKQSIAIAGSDQDALAKLNSNSNSVTVFGKISAVSPAQITVEQITFNILTLTTITDTDGKNVQLSALKPGDKVNVVGTKNQQSLAAQQILVTDTDPGQPAVKTASSVSATSTAATSTISGIKKVSDDNSIAKISTSSAATAATTTPPDPNVAKGLFMFEDPSPQFGK